MFSGEWSDSCEASGEDDWERKKEKEIRKKSKTTHRLID